MNAKISIVVPVYNTARFLPDFLKTLEKQTMTPDEIILVDDGSTDESPLLLKRAAEDSANVHVIHQKHSGAASARNTGLVAASGTYVCFLDSDDWFAPEFLERLWTACMRDELDVCVCQANIRSPEDPSPRSLTHFPPGVTNRVLQPQRLGSSLFQTCLNSPWNKMFRRAFLEEHGLLFQDLPNANDLAFVNSAVALAKRVELLPEHLMTYRSERPGSISRGLLENPHAPVTALYSLLATLRNHGLVQTPIGASLSSLALATCKIVLKRTIVSQAAFLGVFAASKELLAAIREEGAPLPAVIRLEANLLLRQNPTNLHHAICAIGSKHWTPSDYMKFLWLLIMDAKTA